MSNQHPFDCTENSRSLERINMTKVSDLSRTMTFIDQKYKQPNNLDSFMNTQLSPFPQKSITNKNGRARNQDPWTQVGKSKAWLMKSQNSGTLTRSTVDLQTEMKNYRQTNPEQKRFDQTEKPQYPNFEKQPRKY